MSPIAAYYVMVATDLERERRSTRRPVAQPRTSRVERIATALEGLFAFGRPATTRPI